jgi:hypothetical protein
MGGACSMHCWDVICRILIGNNGKTHVTELVMSGRVILIGNSGITHVTELVMSGRIILK